MRRIVALLLALMLLGILAGCSGNESPRESSTTESISSQNPFQQNEENPMNMGAISHGSRNINIDENERLLPLVYQGEEVYFEYYVNAIGNAKNVGFLMFIDGIPQPYRIDSIDAPNEYMHIFNLESDNIDLPFTFIFSPVIGNQGDDLSVSIISIYNPSFRPDMDKTTSYGGYHEILPAAYTLHFETDAEPLDVTSDTVYGTVSLSNEPVTSQLLDTLSSNGMRDIDTDIFNREIFSLLYFDGELERDNLQIAESGTLQVRYLLCGRSGIEYETTFYINHQPIASSEGFSHSTAIDKGFISTFTFDIDLDKLEDFSTFYIVSVPINAADYPDEIFEPIKTQSILLYK